MKAREKLLTMLAPLKMAGPFLDVLTDFVREEARAVAALPPGTAPDAAEEGVRLVAEQEARRRAEERAKVEAEINQAKARLAALGAN